MPPCSQPGTAIGYAVRVPLQSQIRADPLKRPDTTRILHMPARSGIWPTDCHWHGFAKCVAHLLD